MSGTTFVRSTSCSASSSRRYGLTVTVSVQYTNYSTIQHVRNRHIPGAAVRTICAVVPAADLSASPRLRPAATASTSSLLARIRCSSRCVVLLLRRTPGMSDCCRLATAVPQHCMRDCSTPAVAGAVSTRRCRTADSTRLARPDVLPGHDGCTVRCRTTHRVQRCTNDNVGCQPSCRYTCLQYQRIQS